MFACNQKIITYSSIKLSVGQNLAKNPRPEINVHFVVLLTYLNGYRVYLVIFCKWK